MSRMRDSKTPNDNGKPFGPIQADTVCCRAVPLQEPVAEMIRTVEEETRRFLRELAAALIGSAHGSVSRFAAKRSGGGGRVEPDGRVHAYMKGSPRPPDDPEPEKRVEVPAKLWSLLDEIPRESRRIFVLFHIEGSSCEEIARFLGLAEESVKAHLSRAEGHVQKRAPWIKLAELTVNKARHQRLLQQIMDSLRKIPEWLLRRERQRGSNRQNGESQE